MKHVRPHHLTPWIGKLNYYNDHIMSNVLWKKFVIINEEKDTIDNKLSIVFEKIT
jgi:hypothetical protein